MPKLRLLFLLFIFLFSSVSNAIIAPTVTTITPFLPQVIANTITTATYKIYKPDSLKITTDHFPTATGLSVICNSCNTVNDSCYIQIKLQTSVSQAISSTLTMRDNNGQVAHVPINIEVIAEPYTLDSLLTHVARGEESFVKLILDKNPSLVLQKGRVTDYAGRTFPSITAFQYALWAYDRHMWNLILQYLSNQAAYQQLIDLETNGTPYGNFYNFQELLNALTNTTPTQFNTLVGKAERNVPMHVVNEFLQTKHSFYPTPTFTDLTLTRTNYNVEQCHSWFPLSTDQGLGFDYAVGRGEETLPWASSPSPFRYKFKKWDITVDREAMKELFKTRQKEYIFLKNTLQGNPPPSALPINELLKKIAANNIEIAEIQIKNDPTLLLQAGKLVDSSNRIFNHITAFQYAVWSYNAPMWNMILKYLPRNEAKQQFIDLNNRKNSPYGINYDFYQLLDSMREYFETCESWCESKWLDIGLQQRLIPKNLTDVIIAKYGKLSDGYPWFPVTSQIGLGYDWAIVVDNDWFNNNWVCSMADEPARDWCTTSGAMPSMVNNMFEVFVSLEQECINNLNNLKNYLFNIAVLSQKRDGSFSANTHFLLRAAIDPALQHQ